MKSTGLIIIFTISFLLLSGCGVREGVIQLDSRSYLWFNGNSDGIVIIIDDGNPLSLIDFGQTNNQREELDSDKKMLYQVKPGKHDVVIKRNGKVVVHRVIIVNAGSIKEVVIP